MSQGILQGIIYFILFLMILSISISVVRSLFDSMYFKIPSFFGATYYSSWAAVQQWKNFRFYYYI